MGGKLQFAYRPLRANGYIGRFRGRRPDIAWALREASAILLCGPGFGGVCQELSGIRDDAQLLKQPQPVEQRPAFG
jgi:hypothetical protein